MKRKWIQGMIFFVLAQASLLFAQFTVEEISERDKWEEFLETAEIVSYEQIVGRKAVTNPWKLTLQKDGVTRNALWKDPQGIMHGFPESWKAEIAAYRMDKFLEFHMVPPTVERKFRRKRGSCQLWIEDTPVLQEVIAANKGLPSTKRVQWSRMTCLQRAFDNLIGNTDRHQNQILVTADWRALLIDHSRAFRPEKKELIYWENTAGGPMEMKELPREFVEKLKGLTFEPLKNALGDYLSDKQIKAILIRRDLILEEIDRMIKKYGEENVLY